MYHYKKGQRESNSIKVLTYPLLKMLEGDWHIMKYEHFNLTGTYQLFKDTSIQRFKCLTLATKVEHTQAKIINLWYQMKTVMSSGRQKLTSAIVRLLIIRGKF